MCFLPLEVGEATTTVRAYDMAEVRKYLQSLLFGGAISLFIHFKMEAPLPLFLNVFFGVFGMWDWSMMRLNLMGESAEQFPQLKRPFAAPPSPFAAVMKQFTGGDDEEPPQPDGAAPTPQIEPNAPRVEVLDDDATESKKSK